MCVVNQLGGLPCRKCGAPERWQSALRLPLERLTLRINRAFEYLHNLPDDCPMKQEMLDILEGRGSGSV